MELDRIEAVLGERDKFIKFYDLRTKKFNRTTAVMTGSFELLEPFDDDDKYATVNFNSWSGGQYKLIWQTKIDPMCLGEFFGNNLTLAIY